MGRYIVEVEGLPQPVHVEDENAGAVIRFIEKMYPQQQWNLYQAIRNRGIVWLKSGVGRTVLRRPAGNENDIQSGIEQLRHEPFKL